MIFYEATKTKRKTFFLRKITNYSETHIKCMNKFYVKFKCNLFLNRWYVLVGVVTTTVKEFHLLTRSTD